MRCYCWFGNLLGLLLWVAPAIGAPLQVVVVNGGEGGAYAEVANTLTAELATEAQVAVVPWQEFASPGDADVVVTVGVKALQAVADSATSQPVLSTLIPRSAFEKITQKGGAVKPHRPFSAVFLDQPLGRQLELIRLALPGAAKIGVVLGSDSKGARIRLEAAARERAMELNTEEIDTVDDLFPALQHVLTDSELLLALPDAAVFNSGTIQNVLLTAYRYRIPVIGFSAAYVKAGALAAIYSTPTQLSRQTAELLRHFRGGGLPAPQYPRYYSVSVNVHVARSLGIKPIDENQLLEKLTRLESSP